MLNLYIKEYLRAKGYPPKPHTLIKFGINQFMAYKLINNKVKNINLETLAEVCLALDCTPNDILNFQPIEGTVAPSAAMFRLKKEPNGSSPIDYVKILKPEKLNEAIEYLKNMAVPPKTE